MRRSLTLGIAFTALTLIASRAVAQDGMTPPATSAPAVDAALVGGARVRLRLESSGTQRQASVDGALVRLDDDSIVVRREARLVALPRAAVARIEVPDGPPSRGSGAARGAVIGIVAGALVGGVASYATWEPCDVWEIICPSRGGTAALGAIGGGTLGAAIGGVSGAVIGRQHWRSVPVAQGTRVAFVASPSRIGMQLRF